MDRIAALGAHFAFRSSPGEGTTVAGTLPAGALEVR
jgi:signal transduction histidine kinase